MKRLAIGLSLALAATPAMANEITGTRVSGQGAVCSESQGKVVEYNIATRQETSYCYERVEIVPRPTPMPEPTSEPTPQQSTEPVTEPSSETTTQPSNESVSEPVNESVTETTTVVSPPAPRSPGAWQVPEKSTILEVNSSSNVAVLREETVDEYINKVLWSWTYWWEAVMKWFASLNEK